MNSEPNSELDPGESHRRPGRPVAECQRVQSLLAVGVPSLSREARGEISEHFDVCEGCAASFDAASLGAQGDADTVPSPSDLGPSITGSGEGEQFKVRLVQRVLAEASRLDRRNRRASLLRAAPAPPAVGAIHPPFFDPLEGHLSPGQVLRGTTGRFAIVRLIGVGAFTETYLADHLCGPAPHAAAALKIPRLADDMSADAARDRLRLLGALIGSGASALADLDALPNVARVLDTGRYSHHINGRSAESSFIAYEYIEGGRDLGTFLRERYARGATFTGVASATAFADLARALTSAVLDLHAQCVVHGDICPRNILVARDGRLVLIDVGQHTFREVLQGTNDFSGFFYRAPEGVSTPGSDLFSVGAVLYYIATGKEPIGLADRRDIEALKQKISLRIMQANPALFREDAGVADTIAMCLRSTGRVEHASQLLEEIDTSWPESAPITVTAELAALDVYAKLLDSGNNALYRSVACSHLRSCQRTLADMSKGVFDATGTNSIRRAAKGLMGSLAAGDEFLTVALPAFWYQRNIGTNGRFLSACRNAAARGATVRRVFLLDDELSDESLESIVAAQLRAVEALDPACRPNFAVRYCRMPSARRRHAVATGKHFGLFVKDDGPIAMFPVYNADQTLVTLRFRSGRRHVDGLREAFDVLWGDARPLADLKLPTTTLDIDLITSSLDPAFARSPA
jgi:serine/threonine protein kinase